MAITRNGKNRTFGSATMARVTELRRTGVVALAEMTGPEPEDDESFPFTFDILRRKKTGDANPAAGLAETYENTPGLTGLTGRITREGRWRSSRSRGARLADDERLITILDIPETDTVPEDIILTTDHVQFDDFTRGSSVWEVVSTRTRPRDGIVLALVRFVRERI